MLLCLEIEFFACFSFFKVRRAHANEIKHDHSAVVNADYTLETMNRRNVQYFDVVMCLKYLLLNITVTTDKVRNRSRYSGKGEEGVYAAPSSKGNDWDYVIEAQYWNVLKSNIVI